MANNLREIKSGEISLIEKFKYLIGKVKIWSIRKNQLWFN